MSIEGIGRMRLSENVGWGHEQSWEDLKAAEQNAAFELRMKIAMEEQKRQPSIFRHKKPEEVPSIFSDKKPEEVPSIFADKKE